MVVKEAGGVGMILVDEEGKDVAIPFVIPSAVVGKKIGNKILSYISHTSKAISKIFPAKTVLGSEPAPRVAAFSSKGPNALNPEILKPGRQLLEKCNSTFFLELPWLVLM